MKWSTLLPMLVSALVMYSAPACAAEVLTGPARIVDGDTLEVMNKVKESTSSRLITACGVVLECHAAAHAQAKCVINT